MRIFMSQKEDNGELNRVHFSILLIYNFKCERKTMKENVPNAQIQSKSNGYRYGFGRPRQEFHDSLYRYQR